MTPIAEADEKSSASSLSDDDNANSDFSSASDMNSMVSHASTSYSSMSTNSAPIIKRASSALRKGRYARAQSRETKSDFSGESSPDRKNKKKDKKKKHKKYKKNKSDKDKGGEGGTPLLDKNIVIPAVEQAKVSGPKSTISSSIPSSNGSDSNAGPPLPLPKESTLVEENKAREEGYIMARGSRWAIIMKKWSSDCYWTRHNRTELLIFNTYDDFKHWERHNHDGDSAGAEKFIKFKVDFNTKKKKTDSKSPTSVPKPVEKYWMGNVKPKRYTGYSEYLHQFKIEKSTHSGTSVYAAFASTNHRELNTLRKIIKKCMKRGGSKDRLIKLSDRERQKYQPKLLPNQHNVPPKLQGRLITTMYDFDIDDGTGSLASGASSTRGGRGGIKFRKMRHNPAGIIT